MKHYRLRYQLVDAGDGDHDINMGIRDIEFEKETDKEAKEIANKYIREERYRVTTILLEELTNRKVEW